MVIEKKEIMVKKESLCRKFLWKKNFKYITKLFAAMWLRKPGKGKRLIRFSYKNMRSEIELELRETCRHEMISPVSSALPGRRRSQAISSSEMISWRTCLSLSKPGSFFLIA